MTEESPTNQPAMSAQAELGGVDFDLAALGNPNDRERFEREWDRFFNGFYARLTAFFGYSIADVDEREELVQKLFIGAYKAIVISGHPLRSKEAAWSWLTTIGKNLIRDSHAKGKTNHAMLERYAREEAADSELVRKSDSLLSAIAEDEDLDTGMWIVDRAGFEHRLSQLSDGERRILHLRFVEGMEWAEVAAREGVSPGTIRKRYSRMRRFLRDGL
jgi:RNA polymerase sigma factor (sigma-70 family)